MIKIGPHVLKRLNVYTIKVVYKGGTTMLFDCTDFSIKDGVYKWKSVGKVLPLELGVNEIAAVWVVNQRRKFVFEQQEQQ